MSSTVDKLLAELARDLPTLTKDPNKFPELFEERAWKVLIHEDSERVHDRLMTMVIDAGLTRVPLSREFFARLPAEVAPQLLGKLIASRDGRIARLVEVEAYAQDDPAAHTYRGKTARNESMFGPAGHLYVYFSYGIHWCANLVCGEAGFGAGVLLRAAEPVAGIELMRAARGKEPLEQLCSGPGRLAQAFGIDRSFDGTDVTGSGLITVLDDGMRPKNIVVCPRIGLSKNADAPLRFLVDSSRHVSKRAPRQSATE